MRNFISILALGWSYILSVRLLEMQGQRDAEIVYSESTATVYNDDTGEGRGVVIIVEVGDVDKGAARWWATIMAPDQGWKAVVSKHENRVKLSPWSVSVECEQRIDIKWRTSSSLFIDSTLSTRPSPKEAFELLSRFCLLYDLGSQLFVALTTALTFPTHNHYGRVAKLPFPTDMRLAGQYDPANVIMPDSVSYEELPYYMASSFNQSVITSSLCGVFCKPNIPCNPASPWLHPVMNEVPIMEEV
jgi:hypothetical protein